MSLLGVYRNMQRSLKARTNQADKPVVLEYRLVKWSVWTNGGHSIGSINELVEQLATEGWQPQGGICVFGTSFEHVAYYQAMTRLAQQDTRSTKTPTKGDQEIATPHQPQRGGNRL